MKAGAPGSMDTAALIERLAQDAKPVAPLRPPMRRAAYWSGGLLTIMLVGILLFANMPSFERRAHNMDMMIELVGALATGVLGTVAAFHLSLPDRSPRWALLPLPALAVWLSGSGLGCLRHFLMGTSDDWAMRDSMHCVMFIAGFGLPLSAVLLWALSRARPLAPLPVAATGGLAAAGFAAFLLEFFHPFDISIMDLMFHAGAVAAVVAVAGVGGSRMLAGDFAED